MKIGGSTGNPNITYFVITPNFHFCHTLRRYSVPRLFQSFMKICSAEPKLNYLDFLNIFGVPVPLC